MHANIIKILQDLRASYWFIPSLMAFSAFLLSFFMQWLDAYYDVASLTNISWLTTTNAEGARSVLTVIAGSVMGVAGVTFSITIVAVSYASANFGPRLIGNFMRDRGNQLTLGTFIAAFVYCLMILRTVESGTSDDASQSFDAFVPHLSILMALALALASISVLIYFIHHVPETINVGNIAAKIGTDLRTGIIETFPNPSKLQPDTRDKSLSWEKALKDYRHSKIYADSTGFIQTLEETRLGEIVSKHKLLIRVQYRPGDFVITQDPILEVWSKSEINDEVKKSLQACYAVGQHRTAHQNVLFLVDELVEIIARALSPGVNDPFTAITCLNWLKAATACFALRPEHENWPSDSDPVQLSPISFERFVSAIFDQSRQYVCKDRNVSLHVMIILTETAVLLQPGSKQDVLLKQIQKLADACAESIGEHAGGKDIKECHKEALVIISDPATYNENSDSYKWFGGRA